MATVAATMAPIPVRRVAATSAPAPKRTTNAETARFGTCSAFDTTVTIATSTVSRTIIAQRGGETVSSSRRNRQAGQRANATGQRDSAAESLALMMDDRVGRALMMDDRDGRGPDPHQLRR